MDTTMDDRMETGMDVADETSQRSPAHYEEEVKAWHQLEYDLYMCAPHQCQSPLRTP